MFQHEYKQLCRLLNERSIEPFDFTVQDKSDDKVELLQPCYKTYVELAREVKEKHAELQQHLKDGSVKRQFQDMESIRLPCVVTFVVC